MSMTVPDPAEHPLRGVVRVLLDVRLGTLAAASVTTTLGAPDLASLTLIVVALPFSFVPLLRSRRVDWSPDEPAWALALDMLAALGVLVVAGMDSLALTYVGATVALAGLRAGIAGAFGASAAVVLLHAVAVPDVLAAGDRTVLVPLALRLAVVALVGVGAVRLRDTLLSHARLERELSRLTTLRAAEEERLRLAREMHDSVGKSLHGLRLLASVLHKRLREGGRPEAADCAFLVEAIDCATEEGRALLRDLREQEVAALGCHLAEIGRRWAARPGSPRLVVREEDPGVPPLPPPAQADLTRAVDELLENARRHGRAARVLVDLRTEGEDLVVTVDDDGPGMPPPDLAELASAGHYGLVGVHERMTRVGGVLDLARAPAGGVRAALRVPLAPPAAPRSRGVVPQRGRWRGGDLAADAHSLEGGAA